MKYAKLRGRIVEKFGTITNFAKAIGMSRVALYLKLNGKIGFSDSQIKDWARLLDIKLNELGQFFFV